MKKPIATALAALLMVTSVTAFARQSAGDQASTIGLRNFRQLNTFYSLATGVAKSTTDVKNYYTRVLPNLPAEGKVGEISPQTLFAITGLAMVYCKNFIRAEALLASEKRLAHLGVDFTGAPKALTTDIRKAVIAKYAELFWQRAATPTEQATLLAAMEQATDKQPEDASAVRAALVTACTSALSSVDAIRN